MENKIVEQLIVLNKQLSQIVDNLENKTAFTLLTGGIISIISFIIGLLSERFINWLFAPKLQLTFDKECPGYITSIKKRTNNTHYIRVNVVNSRRQIAKQCRAYLVNVEKENTSGDFESTHYRDSLQLAWGAKRGKKDKFSSLDLPKGISQFIDVIRIHEPKTYEVRVGQDLGSYHDLLNGEPGKYKYTIYVSGENVKPASIKIIFQWDGSWDNYKVFLGD